METSHTEGAAERVGGGGGDGGGRVESALAFLNIRNGPCMFVLSVFLDLSTSSCKWASWLHGSTAEEEESPNVKTKMNEEEGLM